VATPASLPVSHPSGVCSDPLRGPPLPPLLRDKGFADVNELLLAFDASFTKIISIRWDCRLNQNINAKVAEIIGDEEEEWHGPELLISSPLVSKTRPPCMISARM